MNSNLFSMKFIIYFFAGFLVLALLVMQTGVTISFYHNYDIVTIEQTTYSVNWFSIKRFDSSFWDTFNTINAMYRSSGYNPFFAIPKIPLIPVFAPNNFGFIIINFLIGIVNALSTLVNVVISVLNAVREMVIMISTFITTIGIWVGNASAGAYEVIYHPFGA